MSHEKTRVTLYTRRGCHLCEEAKRELLSARPSESFTLEEVDIDTDPALRARFGHDIPVVYINDRVAFKHRLTATEFARQLRKAATSDG